MSEHTARAAADAAATAIEEVVRRCEDPQRRRSLIALRRRFLRRGAVDSADLEALAFDHALHARCDRARVLLEALADERATVAATGREAITRERSQLHDVVGSKTFLRALAVSQPALIDHTRSHLRRFGPRAASAASNDAAAPATTAPTKARHLRFESTLVNLVLRGVGRPTPSAAWCGVFVLDTEPRDDTEAPEGADGDLVPWLLHAAPALERVHVQVDLAVLADALRNLGTGHRAVAHEDCWSWLRDAIGELAGPEWAVWSAAIERLRDRCCEITSLAATDADDWLDLHAEARRIVDSLRHRAALSPTAAASVLRIDWRMPFAATAAPSVRASAARALDTWLRVQQAWGFGPLWAQATADGLTAPADRIRASSASNRPGLPTVTTLVASIGTTTQVDEADALVHRLEEGIATASGGRTAVAVTVDAWVMDAGATPTVAQMSPWGSALLVPQRAGFAVRAVRGEPAIFQSRLVAIVPEVIADVRRGLAAAEPTARSCRFTRHLNPSSALGASLASPLTVIRSERGPRVQRIPGDHVGFLTADGLAVPVLDTAATPALAELGPDETTVFRAASTWGWELVASGLPLLPSELEPDGHLPALCGRDGTVVHAERWVLTVTELAMCAAEPTPIDRFVAFRHLLARRAMPDVLIVRLAASPSVAHHLVLGDSALSVESFLRSTARVVGVAIAMRGPEREALVHRPDGDAHMAEVAVSFVDHGFIWPT